MIKNQQTDKFSNTAKCQASSAYQDMAGYLELPAGLIGGIAALYLSCSLLIWETLAWTGGTVQDSL